MTREQFIILFEEHVNPAKYYTYPHKVWQVWQELSHHYRYEHSQYTEGINGLYFEEQDWYDVFEEHVSEEDSAEYYDNDDYS